jgi:hypothetical protein
MDLSDLAPDPAPLVDEVVAQRNGEARQAGATQAEGSTVRAWRERAEASLYFFAVGILGYEFLSPHLHKPICDWLTRVPPYRKLLIIPRGHGKTTLVGQSLPLHVWVQPRATNLYFPGQPGSAARVLLVGETEQRATDHLRVIQAHLESNELLRALWPHLAWTNPRRQARKWNDTELIVPREREWPDPSLRAIGVGGATTGAHPNVLVKDDLTTERAANEPSTMANAILWHTNSRALLASPATDLEFITCTRWAVNDLPGHVMDHDPTVEVNTDWRTITDGDTPIWPEHPTYGAPGAIAALMAEFGTRFPLLYQNSVVDSGLVDFAAAELRRFELQGDSLHFSEDDRDTALATSMNAPQARAELRGRRLDDTVTQEALRGRMLRRQRAM